MHQIWPPNFEDGLGFPIFRRWVRLSRQHEPCDARRILTARMRLRQTARVWATHGNAEDSGVALEAWFQRAARRSQEKVAASAEGYEVTGGRRPVVVGVSVRFPKIDMWNPSRGGGVTRTDDVGPRQTRTRVEGVLRLDRGGADPKTPTVAAASIQGAEG